jgi:hypothetical protein
MTFSALIVLFAVSCASPQVTQTLPTTPATTSSTLYGPTNPGGDGESAYVLQTLGCDTISTGFTWSFDNETSCYSSLTVLSSGPSADIAPAITVTNDLAINEHTDFATI